MALHSECFDVILAGKYEAGKEEVYKLLVSMQLEGMSGVSTKSARNWDVTTRRMHTTEGNNVEVRLWHTASVDKHGLHNVTPSYFHCSACVILIFDRGDKESLFELAEWIKRAKDLSQRSENLLFSLWENETVNSIIDPVDSRLIDSFISEHEIPQSLVFKISTATGENIENFQKVVDAVYLLWNDPDRAPKFTHSHKLNGRQTRPKTKCC